MTVTYGTALLSCPADQAIAEEQLRAELDALSASHAAELAQLDALHSEQLAERAAALEEVAAVLGGEVEALRSELASRQEMCVGAAQDWIGCVGGGGGRQACVCVCVCVSYARA